MLVAVAAFYFPGVLAVVHPRAAGLHRADLHGAGRAARCCSGDRGEAQSRRATRLVGSPRDPGAVRALGEPARRVHRGLPAPRAWRRSGWRSISWRGIPGSVPLSRVAVLGVVAILAAVIVTVATPLGAAIWDVPAELPEPGHLAGEHRVGVGLQLAAGRRLSVPGDLLRRLDVGALAAASPRHHAAGDGGLPRLRRLLGPEHRLHRPDPRPAGRLDGAEPRPRRHCGARSRCSARPRRPRRWSGPLVLGPARDDPTLGFPVADYAIAHPPKHGRIVTYAGVGSYINWRSPSTPVVLNGWLEQYTPQELRDNYRVLRAGRRRTCPARCAESTRAR